MIKRSFAYDVGFMVGRMAKRAGGPFGALGDMWANSWTPGRYTARAIGQTGRAQPGMSPETRQMQQNAQQQISQQRSQAMQQRQAPRQQVQMPMRDAWAQFARMGVQGGTGPSQAGMAARLAAARQQAGMPPAAAPAPQPRPQPMMPNQA